MRSHHVEPHMADVRLKVEGDTLEELFQAALEGMGELIKKGVFQKKDTPEVQRISILSPDVTSLLIDFLSEVLTLSHIQHVVFGKMEFLELTETRLKASIWGRKVRAFDEDIKAVTYHEANVAKNKRGFYETMIVFDI